MAIRRQRSEATGGGPDADRGCSRTGSRLFTTWLTSVDGVDHAITDEMMAAGIQSCTGRFAAVCREIVTAAFLIAPPGKRCPYCAQAVSVSPDDPTEKLRIPRDKLRARMRDLLGAPPQIGPAQTS
ncbi:MAG TPA: hypothetical protein VG756_21240 [Pseudonocardiaceae bacterium]|nr:hypothetical protein [Pseudonocardiaceae bacterium]